MYVFANEKKLFHLQEASTLAASRGGVKLVLLPREKGDGTVPANRSALDTMIAAVSSAGGKMGNFPSDVLEGPTVSLWLEEVSSKVAGLERVDASRGLEAYFAVHDAPAQEDLRKAGNLTGRAMRSVLVGEFEECVNSEKKISHKDFCDSVLALVEDRAVLEKRKVACDTDDFDCALPPALSLGGRGLWGC